jgi:signal peptidase I
VGVPGDFIEKDTNNMFRLNDSNLFHLNDNNFQINNKSPIRLPSKGDIVPIELLTDSFYYNIFNNYENFESDFLNSSAINDSTFVMPKFSHSYYFIMGDNYSNSKDSRHWGPIPDYLIVGKMISFHFVYKL